MPESLHSTIQPSLRRWLAEHDDDLEAVVFDIDGVLLRGRDPVAGAPELIDRFHDAGKPFALLTNDGSHSPEQKTRYLRDCGVRVEPDDLVSCSHALIELSAERHWTGERFFVLGDLGDPCYAELAGLRVVHDADAIDSCRGIIVGENRYDWHRHVTAAFNFLIRHPETPFIIPNPDDYFPSRAGAFGIAAGAIGRFIQQLCASHGVRIEPIYLGKPYDPIFRFSHHRLEKRLGRRIPPHRVLLAGDSLKSDIPGGKSFGYRTALMLTGITTRDGLVDACATPDVVCESL